MGGDVRFAWAHANTVAEVIVHYLKPACERIEIAGSLRRKKERVGDIEIVAIPKITYDKDLLGQDTGTGKLLELEAALDRLNRSGDGPLVPETMGDRYWKLHETRTRITGKLNADGSIEKSLTGIQADLFLVRKPAQWGPLFCIRTGSAEFSKKMMIALRARGYRCEDGRVLDRKNKLVDCPEEIDFFRAAGVKWFDPPTRS